MLEINNKKPRIFYGYIIVLLGFIILFMIGGTFFVFGVFLKPLAIDFGWSRAVTAGAYSFCVFILGFLFMVTGRLNDRLGPRIVVTIFATILGGGYLLMSRTDSIWQLYLFYAIVAVGQSCGLVPMMSTVARWFIKRRGLMTGMVVAGVSTGSMVMAPVAASLISAYGWRNSYLILGLMVWIGVLIPAQFLKRDPARVGQLPDGGTPGQAKAKRVETSSLSRHQALHAWQFWLLCGMYFSYGFFAYFILVHIVPHATDMGFSAIQAAGILSISGATGGLGRILMGTVDDKIGNKKSLLIISGLTVLSIIWLLISRELWMLYLFAVVFGFVYGGMISLESTSVAEMFGLKSHGAILGIVHFCYTTGGAISPLLAGKIFDVTGNYTIAFWICFGLGVTALILNIFETTARNAPTRMKQSQ